MLKPNSSLAVGDWVVLESLVMSRFIGGAWEVAEISKSRVYLQRYRPHPTTREPELVEKKYVAAKSVQYTFTDEASAEAAFEFARANSEVYEREARALVKANRQRFDDYIASLPTVGSAA